MVGHKLPAADSQAAWRQWRGENAGGHAVTSITSWPATLPKPAWTAQVGEGHASPVIEASRICTFGRIGEDEVAACYRPRDGQTTLAHRNSHSLRNEPRRPGSRKGSEIDTSYL